MNMEADTSSDMELETSSDMEIDSEEEGSPHHHGNTVSTPMSTGKKTLVLDLDNTLVFASYGDYIPNYDIYVPQSRAGADIPLFVALRPGALDLIERLSSKYELVIFTAGTELHAKSMLDILDSKRVYFAESNVLHSEHCTIMDIGGGHAGHVKDLGILGRDLSKVIIVDDRPHSAQLHSRNIITVNPWNSYHDYEHADELSNVTAFLDSIAHIDDDVRRLIRPYPQPPHFHSHFPGFVRALPASFYDREKKEMAVTNAACS